MDQPTPSFQDHLQVSSLHQIWVREFGNPDGIPVLFLHGGPGIGCSDKDLRFFNLRHYRVILFDQRGSGQSLPQASLEENKPADHLADILFLLDYFNIQRAILFGGSWGSTLALLFATKYPERIRALVLRGIFLADPESLNYFPGPAAAAYFPEAYDRFIKDIPYHNYREVAEFYFQQLSGAEADKYAHRWNFYAARLALHDQSDGEILEQLKHSNPLFPARIQSYYAKNDFFLESRTLSDQIMPITDLPVYIVHGRFDLICPPLFAWKLIMQLKRVQYWFPHAGHVAGEPAIEKRLIQIMDEISNQRP